MSSKRVNYRGVQMRYLGFERVGGVKNANEYRYKVFKVCTLISSNFEESA